MTSTTIYSSEGNRTFFFYVLQRINPSPTFQGAFVQCPDFSRGVKRIDWDLEIVRAWGKHFEALL